METSIIIEAMYKLDEEIGEHESKTRVKQNMLKSLKELLNTASEQRRINSLYESCKKITQEEA